LFKKALPEPPFRYFFELKGFVLIGESNVCNEYYWESGTCGEYISSIMPFYSFIKVGCTTHINGAVSTFYKIHKPHKDGDEIRPVELRVKHSVFLTLEELFRDNVGLCST